MLEIGSTLVGIVGGTIAGAEAGAGVGIAAGPLGAIAGTVPGDIIGGVIGGLTGMRIEMRKKIKNIGKYREKVIQASGIYNGAMMCEDYTAAMVAAGQCVEGCMKMFLAMRGALSHQLRESHNATKLFAECAKLIQVKEQVHPLDLLDATDAYYLSRNPQKMKAAEYSWEAAHTAGWFALQIARILKLKEFSLVF